MCEVCWSESGVDGLEKRIRQKNLLSERASCNVSGCFRSC